MKRSILYHLDLVLACAIIMLAGRALATPMALGIQGVVDRDNSALPVSVGDPIRVVVSYEPATPLSATIQGREQYEASVYDLRIEFPDSNLTIGFGSGTSANNIEHGGNFIPFQMFNQSYTPALANGERPSAGFFSLTGGSLPPRTGNLPTADQLEVPNTLPNLGLFLSNGVNQLFIQDFSYFDATPAGFDPANPIIPSFSDFGFNYDFWLESVDQFLFLDPEIAIGYDFEVTGGPAITDILIPALLDDEEFELLVGDLAFVLRAGEEFDATSIDADGLTSFTIRGIDPAEGLSADDPTAFVTGFKFAGGGRVQIEQTPISIIPEPSTAMLMATGLLVLAARRAVRCGTPLS